MIDYEQREAAMCRDYLAGFSSPALAVRYGITRERVRQILKPHGLIAERKKQKAQKRMDRDAAKRAYWYEFERRRQDGVEMVENGVSIAKACRATRISYTSLKAALEDRGVKSIHGRWRDETVLRRRVVELIAEGKKARQIKKILDGEKLRVSVHWIYDNYGAELRAWRPAEVRKSEQLPANDNNPAQEQEAA